MYDLVKETIREPDTATAAHYVRRVRQLAAVYLVLFAGSVTGIALILAQAKRLVTYSQRSNVETLTILIFLVLFAYLATLAAPGARGALRLLRWSLRGGDPIARERAKAAALGPPVEGPTVALNVVVEREHEPGAFEIPIADAAGGMGRIRVDGARVEHLDARRGGSNDVLAYFVRQIEELVAHRRVRPPSIVHWARIEDEDAERYLSTVDFARATAEALGRPLWPRLTLTASDVVELERRLSAICAAMRSESFLPQWEYSVEHKLPVIPEPLALIQLSRGETRADPIATMGCATMVVAAAVALLVLFLLVPPWVPGA